MFVLPSDVEGMAISLLEATSYGNCCLVSDIRENAEVVEDSAVMFKKSDVKDLGDQLKELLQNPRKVQSFKERSQSFICNKHNWDQVVEETMKTYKSKRH